MGHRYPGLLPRREGAILLQAVGRNEQEEDGVGVGWKALQRDIDDEGSIKDECDSGVYQDLCGSSGLLAP